MLQTLRRRMKAILWITIASIIVTFLFYGLSTRGTTAQQFVGEIYGRKVSIPDYNSSLHWVRTMALMQYGNRFKEVEKFLNLEEEAWQNLVLLEYAKMADIKVTDKELASLIGTFPIFHKDGSFDPDTYQTVLRYGLGLTTDHFENGMRNSVCISKVRHSVTDRVKVTDQELKQYYRYMNEKINVGYILFRSSDFEKDVNVTEGQIKDYFDEHADEFRLPEKIKMQYVLFEAKPEDVELSESDIKKHYSRNKESYKDPKNKEKVLPLEKVRDKIEKKLKDRKARNNAEEDAEEMLSRLEHGEKNWDELEPAETDFLEKNSSVENIPPACIHTAFSMERGETSSPVGSENSFFILKLVDRESSRVPAEHTQAAGKVEQKIRQIEASKLAQASAEKCLARLKEKKDLAAVAKEHSKEIADTDFFSRPSYIKELGAAPEFRRAAFSLSRNNPFGSARVASGFSVLAFKERKKTDETGFQDEKEKLRAMLLQEKRQNAFSDWFRVLKEKANVSFLKIQGQ